MFGDPFCATLANEVVGGSPAMWFERVALSSDAVWTRRRLRGASWCRIPCGMPQRRTTQNFYGQLVRNSWDSLRRDPRRSPADLARSLFCSERTLNRAFAAAGSTVRDERDCLRLDRAALILLSTKPPADAARRAGFASARQLAQPFRRRFGVTPSRMREIGGALRTVTWAARQQGPYRGSWQQKRRAAEWRAARRLLRKASSQLSPSTMPLEKVERALELRLPRVRDPRAPLTLYELFGAVWDDDHIDRSGWQRKVRRVS